MEEDRARKRKEKTARADTGEAECPPGGHDLGNGSLTNGWEAAVERTSIGVPPLRREDAAAASFLPSALVGVTGKA